jgi:hypothetical protein
MAGRLSTRTHDQINRFVDNRPVSILYPEIANFITNNTNP